MGEGQVYWKEHYPLEKHKSMSLDRMNPRKSGDNWLMSLQGHSLSSLKVNGDQGRSLTTGNGQTSQPSSKKAKKGDFEGQ